MATFFEFRTRVGLDFFFESEIDSGLTPVSDIDFDELAGDVASALQTLVGGGGGSFEHLVALAHAQCAAVYPKS